MELRWTREAIADRDAIHDYIEADRPAAALALDEPFEKKAHGLTEHPQMGRVGTVAGTRESVAHRNHVLAYDVVGDPVRVLRVLHAARQWPPE